MVGWIIALAVVAVLGTGGGIGYSYIAKEHKEARSVPLDRVDFSRLQDGVYTGEYSGGMYKWRANSAQVTVTGGKVRDIKQLSENFEYKEKDKLQALYDRVIGAQSLQVDTISGATLTANGYLMAVQDALLKAER